jgi:peptidoglycan/LPS O-acetylase OafA/YrhL
MNRRNAHIPFAITALLGMALWFIASIKLGKREPWDDPFYWGIVYPVAILASGILGGLFPERPWRWALTLFLAQFIAMTIRNGEPGNLWPLGLLLFCVMAVPGIILAKLGARIRRRLLHE